MSDSDSFSFQPSEDSVLVRAEIALGIRMPDQVNAVDNPPHQGAAGVPQQVSVRSSPVSQITPNTFVLHTYTSNSPTQQPDPRHFHVPQFLSQSSPSQSQLPEHVVLPVVQTVPQSAPPVPPAPAKRPAPAKKGTGRNKADGEKKRPPRKKTPLPPELAALTYEFRKNIKFGEELNPNKKEDPGSFKVAQFVTLGTEKNGDVRDVDLRELLSEQIRELAVNLGCSRIGSLSKFLVRKEIALRIELGAVYDQVNQPSVRTTASEKRTNSLIRIINACFLPQNVDRLIELNDTKGRKDYEAAHGTNPIKDFWMEISDLVNDTEEEQVGTLLFATEAEDSHICKWQEQDCPDGYVNLTDFNVQNHSTCQAAMADLMKCRQHILRSKKRSGENSDDTWDYCKGQHLKPRKSQEMPKQAVYYCDKLSQTHTDLDRAFSDVLGAGLKSESTETPDGGGSGDTKQVASTSKVKEEFLRAIEQTNEDFNRANREASKQRKEMIELQKSEVENRKREAESAQWNEYTNLSEKYFALKDDGRNTRLVKNVAKRIRTLESAINIGTDDSVVEDSDLE
jgi:hypothetical protein